MGWKERERRKRAEVDSQTATRRLRDAWSRMKPVDQAAFLAELAERRLERGATRPPAWEPMPGYDPEPMPTFRHPDVYAETVRAFGGDPHAQALTGETALLPIVAAPWGER